MDVVEITADLVSYNSASQFSNTPVSQAISKWMCKAGISVEFVNYKDHEGTPKTNVIGKKGRGQGGIALLAHSDVVPAEGWDSDPFKLSARQGRLYGRGSADMKGSVACMIAAANAFTEKELKVPVYVIVTADEETDCGGARAVALRSKTFKSSNVRYGIVGEPTLLDVVYAHKGSLKFEAMARGRAAHSSTGKGVNANHKLIPFLNDVVRLDDTLRTDPQYRNEAFDPPHGTLNIVFSDGDTAANVTAPVSRAVINCRPMPDQNWKPIINRVVRLAEKHGVQIKLPKALGPLSTNTDSPIVREALQITGKRKPKTVAYGTDGMVFGKTMELVVMGPGNIQQAHTVDEWIARDQLLKGSDVFTKMVHRFCIENPV